MGKRLGYFTLAILLSGGGAAGQQRPRPPAGPAASPISALAKAQAPIPAPYAGDVEGFVYWETNAVAHKPASSCSGLAITVSVGSSSGSPFEAYKPMATLSNNFKYAGQVKAFLAGGKISVYDVCMYAYDHVPVGPDLQVQLTVSQPMAFSPAVAPQFKTLGPIEVVNGQCNMLPKAAPSTLSDLTAHWGSCQNRAYGVNFALLPSAQMLSSSGGSGGLLSRSATQPGSGSSNVASHGLLLPAGSPTQQQQASSGPVGARGQLLSANPGGVGTAGQPNPQLPPAGTVSNAASTQRRKTLASKLKLSPGTKIRLFTATRTGTDPAILNLLQEQALQTHNQRAAFSATGGSAPSPPATRVATASRTTQLLARSSSAPIGNSHVMSGTDPAADGSTPPGGDPTGGNPNASTPPASGTSGGTPPQQAGSPPTQIGGSSQGSLLKKLEHAPAPISMCRFTTDPVIENVSGKVHNIVVTPDPGTGQYPNNQYAIRGCNFGAVQGKVYVFGSFINHKSPVYFGVDSWSDSLILVTFDPTFQNEYDLKDLTLAVVRTDGKSAQLPAISFYATRTSRPLQRVPHSLVKLPTQYLAQDLLVSPVNNSTLKSAGLAPMSPAASIAFWMYDPIWSSNVGDGYPPTRLSFSDSIDFSKLRAGFALDNELQTLVGNYSPDLSSRSIGVDGGSCKYMDVEVSASLQNSNLTVGVQPAECDNSGKFIYAYYGLGLSVTGPKGDLLDPWPSGLQ
jgi:hypothetical protein